MHFLYVASRLFVLLLLIQEGALFSDITKKQNTICNLHVGCYTVKVQSPECYSGRLAERGNNYVLALWITDCSGQEYDLGSIHWQFVKPQNHPLPHCSNKMKCKVNRDKLELGKTYHVQVVIWIGKLQEKLKLTIVLSSGRRSHTYGSIVARKGVEEGFVGYVQKSEKIIDYHKNIRTKNNHTVTSVVHQREVLQKLSEIRHRRYPRYIDSTSPNHYGYEKRDSQDNRNTQNPSKSIKHNTEYHQRPKLRQYISSTRDEAHKVPINYNSEYQQRPKLRQHTRSTQNEGHGHPIEHNNEYQQRPKLRQHTKSTQNEGHGHPIEHNNEYQQRPKLRKHTSSMHNEGHSDPIEHNNEYQQRPKLRQHTSSIHNEGHSDPIEHNNEYQQRPKLRQISNDMYELLSDGTNGMPEHMSNGTDEHMSNGHDEHMSDGKDEQMFNGSDEHMFDGSDEHMSDGTDEQMFNGSDEHMSDGTDEHMPNGTDEHMSESMYEHKSDGMNEHMSDGTDEHMSDGRDEHMFDGTDEHMPNDMDEHMSDGTDEHMPNNKYKNNYPLKKKSNQVPRVKSHLHKFIENFLASPSNKTSQVLLRLGNKMENITRNLTSSNEYIMVMLRKDVVKLLSLFNLSKSEIQNLENMVKAKAELIKSRNTGSENVNVESGHAMAEIFQKFYNLSYNASRAAILQELKVIKHHFDKLDAWGPWSEWTACPKSCKGQSFRMKERKCLSGKSCIGKSMEFAPCPNDCSAYQRWTAWSGWGKCSATCATGISIRERECKMAEGGCEGQDSQMKSCTMSSCPITIITSTTTTTTTHAPVNVPLEWGQWSECSVTCGMGVIFRQKYCHDQMRQHCKGPVQRENKRCITDSCNQQVERQQMQILEGNDAVLPCRIKKKPHNSIYWITPKGKKIDSHTVIKRVLVVDDKLLLRETQRREHGVYHCVSSDGQTSDVEIDVLWCGLELCQHGANCIRIRARLEHGHRRFKCVCTSGYSGMFCEKKMPLPFSLILLIILMSVLVFVIILAIVITYICHRKKKKPLMTDEKGGGDDKDGYEMVATAENDNTLESIKEETDTHNLSVVSNDNSLMEIRETDFKDFKKQNSFNMFRSASGQELTKKNLETGSRQGSRTSLHHARRMSEPTMTIELQEEKVQPPSAKYEENYPDNEWYYVEDRSDFTFPDPPEESELNKIFNSVEKEERFYENYMRNNTGKAATVDGMWHEDSPEPHYEDMVISERNNNKIDFNISFENVQQQSNRRLPSVDDSSKYAVKLSESYHKPGHEMTKTYELKNFLDKFSPQASTENLQARGQNRQQYHWSNSQEDQSRSNDNVLQNVSRRLSFEGNVKQNESEAKEQNTTQPQFIKGSREKRFRDGQTDEIKSQDIKPSENVVSQQRIEEQNPHHDEDDDCQIRMVHRKTFLSPQKRLVRGSPGGISNQSHGTTGHMSIQSPQTPGNMSSQSHGTPGHMSGQSQSTPDHMSSQSPVTPGHMSSQSPQTSGHIYSLSHGTPDHMSSQSSGTPGHMSGQSPQKPGYISSQNRSTPSNLSSQSHGTPGYMSSRSPQTPSNMSSQSHGTPGYISSRSRVTPSSVSSQSHETPGHMSSQSPQTPGYISSQSRVTPLNMSRQSHGTPDPMSSRSPQTPGYVTNQSHGTPDQISNQSRGTPDQISNQSRGTPDQISNNSCGTPDQISNQSRGTPDQISNQSHGIPDQISSQSPHTTSFMNNQIRRVPINMTNQTPAISGHMSSQSYSSPGRMSSQTPATPDNMSGQRPVTLGQIISQSSATPDYMSSQSPVTPGQMSSQSPVSLGHMFGQSPVTLGPITRYSNSTPDDISNQSHETPGWMADSAPSHLNNQSQSEPSQMTDQSLGLTSMRTIQSHGTPGSSKNKGMTDAFQFGEYSDDMVYRSPNKNRANQRQGLEPIEIEVEMSKKYRNNVKARDTPGLPPMYLTSTPNKQSTEHYEHVLSEEEDVLFHQREAYDTANKSNNERNEFLKEIHDDIFQCIIQTNDSGKMDINAGRLDDDVSNCQTGHQLSPISEESTEQRHSGEFVQTLSGQHSEEFIVPRLVLDEEENEIRLDQLSNQGNDMDSTLQYNSSRSISTQASASESGTSPVSENLDSLHSHFQTPEQ